MECVELKIHIYAHLPKGKVMHTIKRQSHQSTSIRYKKYISGKSRDEAALSSTIRDLLCCRGLFRKWRRKLGDLIYQICRIYILVVQVSSWLMVWTYIPGRMYIKMYNSFYLVAPSSNVEKHKTSFPPFVRAQCSAHPIRVQIKLNLLSCWKVFFSFPEIEGKYCLLNLNI